MFIDINTYIGHWPFRNLKYNTLDGLDTLARRYDITHMVVSNIHGFFYKDGNAANLELLEELKAYGGKTVFLPLAIVNPLYIEWEKDARAMLEAGFTGFELAPVYHGYSMAPEVVADSYSSAHYALEVLKLAEELDVPVRIPSGMEDVRGRSPLDGYRDLVSGDYHTLLSKNRNAHVFVTNFAPRLAEENLRSLLKERKNTYFDCTMQEIFTVAGCRPITEVLTEDQICFGSRSPFNYMESVLLRAAYGSEFCFEKIQSNPARAFKTLR